jgi:putative ABC transport system permease protein
VDAYRTVVRDPNTVIVGRDLRADRQSGLSKGALRVGDVVQLRNPTTGRARSLVVAGIAAAARYAGTDHIYVARSLVDELAGGPAATNVLFVATRPGVNTDVLAAIIDGTHLPNGTYARSFNALARESLSAQRQFLDLSAGYAAVGLVAVLAGISVLMVDRVRERRQQISLLRALGFSRVTIRRSYAIEAATIALEGTLTGVLTGCLVAWRLAARGSLGQPLPFSAPVLPLLAIVAAVLAATLAATLVAARQAGRLRPALALRASE